MKVERVKFKSAGYELVGEIDLPDEFTGKLPTVILFHGLTNARGDCPLINETSEALVKNGFAAFRFDFYGSGESPGEMRDKTMNILEQNAKDAIEFIAKDERVDSNRLGLWGRSLGGTLVCLLPPDPRIKVRAAVSPSVRLENAFLEKFEKLKRKEVELEEIGKRLPGTGDYKGPFEFKKGWFESLKGLDSKIRENLKNLDTVLVLGTALDQKVTPDNTCIVMNDVKEPKKIMIYMTDHDYAGFEEEAVREILNWFKRFLKYREGRIIRFFKRGIIPLLFFEVGKSFLQERLFFNSASKMRETNIQVLRNRTIYSYCLGEEFNKSGEAICREIINQPPIVEDYGKYCDEIYENALASAKQYGKIETDNPKELIEIFKTFNKYVAELSATIIPERSYIEEKVKNLLLRLKGPPLVSEDNIYLYITDLCLNTIPSLAREEREDLLKIAKEYITKTDFKEKLIEMFGSLKEEIKSEKAKLATLGLPYFGGGSYEDVNIRKKLKSLLRDYRVQYTKFEEHAYNYAWLEVDFGVGRVIPKEDFEERLLEYLFAQPIVALAELNMDYIYWKSIQEGRFDEFKENKEFQKKIKPLCEFLSTEAHVRLKRRFTIAALYYYLERHLRKFVEIYNANYENKLSEEYLSYLKIDEIIDSIDPLQKEKCIDLSTLRDRATCIVVDNRLPKTKNEKKGDNAENYVEVLKKRKELKIPKINRERLKKLVDDKKAIFRGVFRGFYGKAEGRMTLFEPQEIFARQRDASIDRLRELAKIEHGDILVTTMITPSLITLVSGLVKGAITEEGTISCHAVTLSHELKIPLITDAEDVTEFLRTGDIIEVDFGKGTFEVKKLAEMER